MGNVSMPDAHENVDLDRLLALDIAVQALPERYQTIVRCRWYEQRGYAEIAQFLGISTGTARNLASQALTLLRETLQK
jgi:RNA polymerase sigma factor (sigma-70 family)